MATKNYNIPDYLKGKTFAEAANELKSRFDERPDPISQGTYKTLMGRLKDYQEDMRSDLGVDENNELPTDKNYGQFGLNATADITGALDEESGLYDLDALQSGIDQLDASIDPTVAASNLADAQGSNFDFGNILGTAASFAPIAGNLINLFTDDKPEDATRRQITEQYTPESISADPVINLLREQEGTARQSMLETSGGDFGEYASQVGNLQSNTARALTASMIDINKANAAQRSAAQQGNIGIAAQNVGFQQAYDIQEDQDAAAYGAQTSQNISDLTQNVGAVGKEFQNKQTVDQLYGENGAMRQLLQLKASFPDLFK